MDQNETRWIISGYDNQPIYGNTHLPKTSTRGILLICHGFKGYKDYGFFPHLAEFSAQRGLVTHRFNFSHSGMTNQLDTFERPDLFEIDTWTKQIYDLEQVATAVQTERLAGGKNTLPVTWFGHSRGGVTVLLAASQSLSCQPSRVICAAAPHTPCHLDESLRHQILADGFIESPSSRTGQVLRIARCWLEEIESDPQACDPCLAIKKLTCPTLLIHGETDQTVSLASAQALEQAAEGRAQLVTIPNASHTFNAQNPLDKDCIPPATQQMMKNVINFSLSI